MEVAVAAKVRILDLTSRRSVSSLLKPYWGHLGGILEPSSGQEPPTWPQEAVRGPSGGREVRERLGMACFDGVSSRRNAYLCMAPRWPQVGPKGPEEDHLERHLGVFHRSARGQVTIKGASFGGHGPLAATHAIFNNSTRHMGSNMPWAKGLAIYVEPFVTHPVCKIALGDEKFDVSLWMSPLLLKRGS